MVSKKICFLLFFLVSSSALANEDLYENTDIGFSLLKPESWHFLSKLDVQANRDRFALSDKKFGDLVRKKARLPIVSISKYPDPTAMSDVSPTVNVGVSPLDIFRGADALDILRITVSAMQKAVTDFKFVKEPHELILSNHKAASADFTFKMGNNMGDLFSIRSRFWVIPKGEYTYLIGMAGPAEGEDVSEKEFEQILSSIVISKI